MPEIPSDLIPGQRITFECPKCGHALVRTVGEIYEADQITCSQCLKRIEPERIQDALEARRNVDPAGPPTELELSA